MRAVPQILIAVLSFAPPAWTAAGDRIEDNSFLIEEAYNQEPGVVQHISAFERSIGGEWAYAFTEEWPVFSQDHQLAVTLPVERVGERAASATGLADLQLHYRYAFYREEEAPVAGALRLSVLLPTGNETKGLGAGGVGFQVNVPISVNLGDRFVTHWNALGTYVPAAWNGASWDSVTGWAVGQSFVWLARPWFNLLVEALWEETETSGDGGAARTTSLTVNPGFRAAFDVGSLQIVWGAAVPLGVGPSRGDRGVFLYLSFEHPLPGTPRS